MMQTNPGYQHQARSREITPETNTNKELLHLLDRLLREQPHPNHSTNNQKLLVMLMSVCSPLQILCCVGFTCTLAVGKTLISISTGATLVQPTLAVRVTVAVLLVLFVKMSGAIVVVFTPEPLVRAKP